MKFAVLIIVTSEKQTKSMDANLGSLLHSLPPELKRGSCPGESLSTALQDKSAVCCSTLSASMKVCCFTTQIITSEEESYIDTTHGIEEREADSNRQYQTETNLQINTILPTCFH